MLATNSATLTSTRLRPGDEDDDGAVVTQGTESEVVGDLCLVDAQCRGWGIRGVGGVVEGDHVAAEEVQGLALKHIRVTGSGVPSWWPIVGEMTLAGRAPRDLWHSRNVLTSLRERAATAPRRIGHTKSH
jgi:hypothetical protein